jgi:heme exporter protein A
MLNFKAAQWPLASGQRIAMTLQAIRLGCIRGDLRLFSDIDFRLVPGDALRIAGANGSGKTSLLRILCGLSRPSEGELLWDGHSIRALRETYSDRLVYIGHANALKDDLLAWENLALAAELSGHPVSRQTAYDALDQLGLRHIAELPARLLSQGQRRRVALARLRIAVAPLWILDEPCAALDATALDALVGMLDTHLDDGGILVYTTHHGINLSAGRMLQIDLHHVQEC